MKSLSSLDLYFLIKELKSLEKAHLDKVYQGEGDQKGDFTFQLNKQGKYLLRFMLPSLMYLTPTKPDYGKMPGHFATFLRRNLGNARIHKIEQQAFERIVEFSIENKKGEFTLVFELIPPGNLFLLNNEKKIVSLLSPKKLKDRTLRGGVVYEPPPSQFDITKATKGELEEQLGKTSMDSIVKSVAIDLGLGGTYAEELCARAGVDKASKGSKQDIKKIAIALKKLLDDPIKPNGNQKDVYPIIMQTQKATTTFDSFSLALSSTEPIIEVKKTAKSKKDKTQNVLKQQQAALEGYNKSADENQKKGELIYERYQELQALIDSVKKARETMSWKEIKEKLKNKHIKSIDESKGTITVEF